jgi:hypothetical protein
MTLETFSPMGKKNVRHRLARTGILIKEARA